MTKDTQDKIMKKSTTDTCEEASAEMNAMKMGIRTKAKFWTEFMIPKAVPLH